MAAIFEYPRDNGKRHPRWCIEFTNEFGKRQRKVGFRDKRLTEDLAAKLETDARRKRLELDDPAEEEMRNHRRVPIKEHVDAYETHLGHGSRTIKHKTLTLSRVRKVVEEAGIQTLNDLKATRIDRCLHSLGEAGLGARTINHYVQALIAFCNFLVSDNRLSKNPLKALTRYKAKLDVRHKRRALTFEEVRALIKSARESSETIQSYEPEMRARLYEIAFLTGFRRNEVASLTPRHFQLDGPRPAVSLKAQDSKNREEGELPLHQSLQTVLPQWLKGLKSTDRLFPRLAGKKTWLMVRKDLERVGIPYETQEGIADFHSLRHAYVSGLLRNNASPTQARQLARHTDLKTTMVYTHVDFEDQAKALERLPDVSSLHEPGQHIGRTACHPTSDDTSRRDARRHKDDDDETSESTEESRDSDAAWHNETGDGDLRHHPLKSGGGGNRTRSLCLTAIGIDWQKTSFAIAA